MKRMRAAAATSSLVPVDVSKTIWGSPAGKKRIATQLVKWLPAHKVYVEPFIGSAAVLFAKDRSQIEVINDADPEIADAYRTVQKLTEADINRLEKKEWVGSKSTYNEVLDMDPQDHVDRLYRFLYLSHFSYGKLRGKSFSPSAEGVMATTVKRIRKFAPRLKGVHVNGGDYERVVRKYDSADTAFFLDPPYPGYNVNVGESKFDEARFFELCKSLKGKFLITYGVRGEFPKMVKSTNWWTKIIKTPRTISAMRGVGGDKYLSQLCVANYVPTAL
jgi:DNA adenine methylase